jgi:hypothetical protein
MIFPLEPTATVAVITTASKARQEQIVITAGPTEQEQINLTSSTPLLDFEHVSLQSLILAQGWMQIEPYERIGAVYQYVRDRIGFGYNASDDLPASRVLNDGIGQCNTKGTLLMALLRGVGIPCRFHGFTIDKALQKGAVTGIFYFLTPPNIIHSWVEIWFNDRWINLEGFILDQKYLSALQRRFSEAKGAFCGYGVATPNLQHPQVDWMGEDTYIQKDGINHDFGIFDTPDDFYARHGTNLAGLKRWLYVNFVRHIMNRTVARIRAGSSQW